MENTYDHTNIDIVPQAVNDPSQYLAGIHLIGLKALTHQNGAFCAVDDSASVGSRYKYIYHRSKHHSFLRNLLAP